MPLTFHNLQLYVLPYSYIENNAMFFTVTLWILLANFFSSQLALLYLFLVLIGYKCFFCGSWWSDFFDDEDLLEFICVLFEKKST